MDAPSDRPTLVENVSDEMLGMQEEVFGPVAFTASFETAKEVLGRARRHKYGLRAARFGGAWAPEVAGELRGEPDCHPVPDYTFGQFGTVALNDPRSASWRGALIVKAVGGYSYSGWIWETVDGCFRLEQGRNSSAWKLRSLVRSCSGVPLTQAFLPVESAAPWCRPPAAFSLSDLGRKNVWRRVYLATSRQQEKRWRHEAAATNAFAPASIYPLARNSHRVQSPG